MNAKYKKITAVALVSVLVTGGLIFYFSQPKEEDRPLYQPTIELPSDYMVITEYPKNPDDMLSVACLSSLINRGEVYNPFMILDQEGKLSSQQIYTLTNWKTDRAKLLFVNSEALFNSVNSQLSEAGLSPVKEEHYLPLTSNAVSNFIGFDGVITVSSYSEALWATAVAKNTNMALISGRMTYPDQESAWKEMKALGIPANYIIATNPFDVSLKHLNQSTPDYDSYDDAWFCPALSVLTGELAVHHDAFVITDAPPIQQVDWTLNMELSQNRRAMGYYDMIRKVSSMYGPAEYVCIVGSASAVPQFLTQIGGQGEITNSDIIYGFLDDDPYTQDAAVGRLIQFDASLASNQLSKSLFIEDFADTVPVNYRDIAGGPHEKNWRTHGASFSGYDITYKRMQATPARWICKDYDDAGFTYDYWGPSGTGVKLADGVVDSKETNIIEICQGSGYVAYRGHGSDTGSLYGIRVRGPNGDEHALRYGDCQTMNVPPQIAFFVSCLNGKIYGHGPGTQPQSDVNFENLFTLNYLSAGPAVLIGATEISYSNIGQDIPALRAEYGLIEDDHKWDHNDAWYAFVWDGILNHPEEHGTAGKAVQWCENRYMAYGPNNSPTPFEPKDTVDWREVTFFTMYGDPAFRPAIPLETQPNYDPWHNGANDN